MKSTHKYFPVNDAQRAWGLYATCAGHSATKPGNEFPSRSHPDEYYFTWEKGRILHEWQIAFVERGSGIVEFRHRKFAVREGSLIVFPPRCWHRFCPDADTGWTTLWIGFGGDLADRLVGGAGFNPQGDVRDVPANCQLHALLADLVSDILGSTRVGVYSAAARIPALVAALMESLDAEKQDSAASDMIHRAQEYMLEHCGETIDFEALAASLGMTYRSFRYMFAKETATSPLQYQLNVKLVRAKNLLKSSDMPIAEIAETLGFNSTWYFSHFFRKHTSTSAAEYRAAHAQMRGQGQGR